jgi:hypothetical protein
MPKILDLRDDLVKYIKKHDLVNKWQKVRDIFEKNPFHPSLNTELL